MKDNIIYINYKGGNIMICEKCLLSDAIPGVQINSKGRFNSTVKILFRKSK